LIEPDPEELVVPDVEYSTVINLPTTDFQKMIRDLNSISDRIEIKSVGNDLIFSCDGAFASSKIFRSEFDGYMEFIQNPQRVGCHPG
jgi:proliferating cell nuclear antigen